MIAYKHYRFKNNHYEQQIRWGLQGTVAVDLVDKAFLMNMLAQYGTAALMNIGVARCNPKDQFEKRIGREKAVEHMAVRKVVLEKVEIRTTERAIRYIYNFECKIEHPSYIDQIRFALSTIAESDKVQLVYATL